jgi:hypothetical protein
MIFFRIFYGSFINLENREREKLTCSQLPPAPGQSQPVWGVGSDPTRPATTWIFFDRYRLARPHY